MCYFLKKATEEHSSGAHRRLGSASTHFAVI